MSKNEKGVTPEITNTEMKSKDEEYEYVPPDGGWGWLVLGGCIVVNILTPATVKVLGIYLVEIYEIFHPSPVAVSWILALAHCLLNCVGPLSSYLCTKYGFRFVAALGGLFAASGMIFGGFSTSIEHLYLTFGILVGIGSGLTYPITVFVIASYFVKLRGFANGLAISGVAFGSIILPPITRFFFKTYGFRGASLIMGGVILNVFVAASIYDPVQKHLIKVLVNKKKPNPVVYKKCDIRPRKTTKIIKDSEIYLKNEFRINIVPGRPTTEPLLEEENGLRKTKRNGTVVSKYNLNSEITGHNSNKINSSCIGRNFLIENLWNCCKDKELKTPLEKKEKSVYGTLIKNPVFVIMVLSYSSTSIGFSNFTMLLPIYAHTLGFDKDEGAYLLSIVSIFDLTARIISGTLSDWLPIDKKFYFIFGLFFSGVFLCCIPLGSTYLYVSIFCALFGFAAGIYIGVTAIVMANLLGDDNLAPTYSLSLFLKGVMNLVSPPIFGFFYQVVGDYGPVFVVLGLVHISGALIWLYIPCKSRKK